MQTRTVELSTPDGPMACYEALPAGGAAKAVVVIQEAYGVNRHIESVCERFAELGFHSLAPHLFHRAGGGTAPYGDFEKVLPLLEGVTDDGVVADVDAVLAHLRDEDVDAGSVGTVGFCIGGRFSFLVALRRPLGAAVGFYGGGIVTSRFRQLPALVGEAPRLRTPWLGLFGDRDESIPVEDVEVLRESLADAAVESEVVRYEDAEHGFFCDERSSYHPEAAADGWDRTRDWFGRHLDG